MRPECTLRVAEKARRLGFDLCGVAPAEKFPELEQLPEWLARGYAGEMRYLHNPKRHSPELALPGARSVIVCAMNYNTPFPRSTEARAALEYSGSTPPLPENNPEHAKRPPADAPRRGWISRYAWGHDYHEVLGERLEQLTEWLRSEFGDAHVSRWYVDTGPIVERVAAKWAGLGWLGKNTCLINKDWGSWLFLGVVITTLELAPSLALDLEHGTAKKEKERGGNESTERDRASPSPVTIQQLPDTPATDLCGQCTLCIDACPTGALVEPYVMDARRCISYLTIELRGEIPAEFHEALGWHIFGCDICQDVCPFNRKAPVTDRPEFMPRAQHQSSDMRKEGAATLFAPALEDLQQLSDEDFARVFASSAIRRTRRAGLARNVALALAQSAGKPVTE